MVTSLLLITILLALVLVLSALAKLRHDPRIVRIMHEVLGVPMKWFPVLAGCQLAGAVGLVLGIWRPVFGLAAAVGVALYFMGAVVAHLRVSDVRRVGPAAFLLVLAAGLLAMRLLTLRYD